MSCIANLVFESELANVMTALTDNIRTNCGMGNTVVIDRWTPNSTSYVFDADGVSIHRDIYKETDWQGTHSITVFYLTNIPQ
jgi:hypothetical protein